MFQIAVGDVLRNVRIPFQMIMPKNFAVPNFHTGYVQLDFKVNFLVITQEGIKIQRSFPIIIQRKN